MGVRFPPPLPVINLQEQQNLLAIVETWDIKEKPEYRGFRCANCQEYKNKAWYHWLNISPFRIPVHLCENCEVKFNESGIIIDESKRHITDIQNFGKSYKYSPEAVLRFKEIVAGWPTQSPPVLKAFVCDECGRDLDIDPTDNMRKGYHVWWKNDQNLTELHFHNNCAAQLKIK